jgi:hypothetical protein
MYVSAPYRAAAGPPLPLLQETGCLWKQVVIALARETKAETYRKDYTDPLASVAL